MSASSLNSVSSLEEEVTVSISASDGKTDFAFFLRHNERGAEPVQPIPAPLLSPPVLPIPFLFSGSCFFWVGQVLFFVPPDGFYLFVTVLA